MNNEKFPLILLAMEDRLEEFTNRVNELFDCDINIFKGESLGVKLDHFELGLDLLDIPEDNSETRNPDDENFFCRDFIYDRWLEREYSEKGIIDFVNWVKKTRTLKK